MNISFNSLQKRLCKLTDKDKELLKKYNDMEELNKDVVWESYMFEYPKCGHCKIQIDIKWTFCPNCGYDLPETEHNKVNECEAVQ